MSNVQLKFLIVVVGIAILTVVGSYVYKNKSYSNTPKSTTPYLNQTTPKTSEPSSGSTTSEKLPQLPATASAEQLSKYANDVAAMAKTASTVKFTNCVAAPLVLKIQSGASVTFQNSDSKDIKLVLNPANTFDISAGNNVNTKISIDPGIYRYNCTLSGAKSGNPDAGIVYIVK